MLQNVSILDVLCVTYVLSHQQNTHSHIITYDKLGSRGTITLYIHIYIYTFMHMQHEQCPGNMLTYVRFMRECMNHYWLSEGTHNTLLLVMMSQIQYAFHFCTSTHSQGFFFGDIDCNFSPTQHTICEKENNSRKHIIKLKSVDGNEMERFIIYNI